MIDVEVCDEPLYSVRAHDQGVLLAIGSHSGTTTLLEVSSALYSLQRNEKSVITAVTSDSLTTAALTTTTTTTMTTTAIIIRGCQSL